MLESPDLDGVKAMPVRCQKKIEQEFAARDMKERERQGQFTLTKADLNEYLASLDARTPAPRQGSVGPLRSARSYLSRVNYSRP